MTPSARTYTGQYRKFLEGQRRLGERGQRAMDFPIGMDNIISAIIGALSGGGLSWVFFFKASKTSANADAISKAANAMGELLERIEQQQIVNNKIISQKDESIAERDLLIEKYRESLEINNQKIKELTYTVNDQKRKLDGMQKLLDKEMGSKKFAERLICIDEVCQIRRPTLGTFESK